MSFFMNQMTDWVVHHWPFSHRPWNWKNAYLGCGVSTSLLLFYFLEGDQTKMIAWIFNRIFFIKRRKITEISEKMTFNSFPRGQSMTGSLQRRKSRYVILQFHHRLDTHEISSCNVLGTTRAPFSRIIFPHPRILLCFDALSSFLFEPDISHFPPSGHPQWRSL